MKKWGNSAAVRIPAPVLRASGLALNEAVEVREDGGRIVLEPVREKKFDLRALLDGITPKNQHEPADFGDATGKEVW